MLDIGGWELLVIVVLAIVVVGPKDLPALVRNVGRWVGKARSMAREFQSGMEDLAKEAEIDELRKSADIAKTMRAPMQSVRDEVRKMDRDIRESTSDGARANPARSRDGASSGGQRPAAPRRAEAPPRQTEVGGSDSDARGDQSPAPRPEPRRAEPRTTRAAQRDAEDDDILSGFQRGVRGGDRRA